MDNKELNKRLEKALEDYKADVSLVASDEYSKKPINEGEAFTIARDVFYLANDFREAIVEYLKTN